MKINLSDEKTVLPVELIIICYLSNVSRPSMVLIIRLKVPNNLRVIWSVRETSNAEPLSSWLDDNAPWEVTSEVLALYALNRGDICIWGHPIGLRRQNLYFRTGLKSSNSS